MGEHISSISRLPSNETSSKKMGFGGDSRDPDFFFFLVMSLVGTDVSVRYSYSHASMRIGLKHNHLK